MTRADYIAAFRQANPDYSAWSDDAILDRYAWEYRDQLDAHPELKTWAQQRRKDNTSFWEEAKGAIGSGIDSAQAQVYDTAALAGRITGIDSLEGWGTEGRLRNQAEAADYQPAVQRFEDVRTAGDFGYWLTNIVGSNAPQIAGTAAAAAVATAAAPEAAVGAGATGVARLGVLAGRMLGLGAGRSAAAGLSAKAVAGMAGASAAGFTQMQNYGQLVDSGGENVVSLAIANGLIGSALEAYGPARMIRTATGFGLKKAAAEELVEKGVIQDATKQILLRSVPGPLVSAALHAAKEGSSEMLTEMAQEATTIATEFIANRHNPGFKLDEDQIQSRILNSGVAGFVLGGAGGAVAKAAERGDSGREPTIAGTEAPAAQMASYEVPIEQASAAQVTNAQNRVAQQFAAAQPAAPVTTGTPTTVTATPAEAAAPILATPQSQSRLVAEFQVPADQAATIPEEDAQRVFAEKDAAIAKAKAAEQVAAQQAEQQRIAAEARAQAQEQALGTAGDRQIDRQNALIQQDVEAGARELEAQAARALKPAKVKKALATPPAGVPAPQNGPAVFNATVKAQQPAPETMNPVTNPDKFSRPTPTPSEPTALVQGSVPSTPVTSAPAPAPAAAPVQAPPSGSPPAIAASHGLVGLDQFTGRRFIPRNRFDPDEAKAYQAAGRGDTHDVTSRYLVFLSRDGTREIRKASSKGLLAVRENQDASPNTIAKFLQEKANISVSSSTITKIIRGGKSKLGEQTDALIRDVATKLGFTGEGRWANPTAWAKQKGMTWEGVIEADRGANLLHNVSSVTPEQWAAFTGRMTSSADLRKTDVKVSDPVISRIAETFKTDPTVLERLGAGTPVEANLLQRTLFEKALEAGTPAERARFKTMFDAGSEVAYRQVADAFAKAIEKNAKTTSVPTAPASPKTEKKVEAAKPDIAFPEVRIEPKIADDVARKIVQNTGSYENASKFLTLTNSQAKRALDALLMSALDDGRPKTFNGLNVAQAKFQASVKENLVEAEKIREMFRGDLRDALSDLREKELISDAGESIERVVRRRGTPEDYLGKEDDAEKRFNSVLREIASRGGKVSIRQATDEIGRGGAYIPSKNEIHLFLNNVVAPTTEDLLNAIHESVHHMTEGQPAWLRNAIQDTFERLPDNGLAFHRSSMADTKVATGENIENLSHEDFQMERAVEHATLQGVSREYAQGLLPAIWRSVKGMLYKAAIYLQGTIMGPENVGGALAKGWIENTTAAFLAGDIGAYQNFLSLLGRAPTHAQILRYTSTEEGVLVNEIDPDTGAPVVRDNWDLTDSGIEYRNSALLDAAKAKVIHNGTLSVVEAENELRDILNAPDALFTTARATALSEVQKAMAKTIANKKVAVAVANQLGRLFTRLFDVTKSVNPDLGRENILALRKQGESVADDLTYEIFLKRLGLPDPKAAVTKEIDGLTAQIKLETGDTYDGKNLVPPTLLIDDLPKHMQDVANDAFLAAVSKYETHIGKLKDRLSTQSGKLSTGMEERRATIQESTKKLHDWMTYERDVMHDIIEHIRSLKKGVKQESKVNDQAGYARATLETLLEGDTTAFDTEFTEDILTSMGLSDLPLGAIFRQLFALERDGNFDLAQIGPVDLRGKIIDEVATKPSSDLTHLLGDGRKDTKANALFAAIHAFIKKEARKVAIIRLQLDEAVQRSDQINEVRAALKEQNDVALAELMERVKKDLTRPANRVIYETLKERDEALKQQKRIAEIDRTLSFLGRTTNAIKESILAAQQRIEVSADWDLEPGGKIFNPTSPDMPSDQVTANQTVLSLDLGVETSLEQLQEIRANMALWLEARKDDPNTQDTVYRTMQRQFDRLKILLMDRNYEMLTGLKNGVLQNLSEQMNRMGVRSGRLLSRLTKQLETAKRAETTNDFRDGKNAERARQNFIRASGLKVEWEKDNIYDEALFFLRRDFGASERDALGALRSHLLKHPNETVRKVASSPQLWSLYEKRLLTAKQSNARMIKMSLDYGNRVRDEKIKVAGKAALRKPIERGAEGFTFMTRLHHRVGAALSSWGLENIRMVLDDSPTSPLADAKLKLRTDATAFGKGVDEFFGKPEFAETFLRPMFCDESDPNIPAPDREDGLKLYVPAWVASKAYEDSNGRVLEAARRIYQALGTDPSQDALENYQVKVLNHVSGTLKKLGKRANLESPTERVSLVGLPHVAMDAVMEEDFKREWVTFPDYSVEENRANTHVILTNAIMGRNLEVARAAALQVEKDLKQFVLPATAEERARLKAANPEKYKQIEEALRVKADWTGDNQILKAIDTEANPEADPSSTQIGVPLEVFSLVAQMMLSGPRTAIRDLASLTAPITLERSLSFHTLERMAVMHGRAAKYIFGSALNQLFGANTLAGDWHVRAMEEAGLGDPIRGLTFRDLISGTYGKGDHFEKSTSGKIQRGLRLVRTVAGNQRLGFGKDAVGPQARVHTHAWFSQVQRFAATATYMDAATDLARRAAAYYDEHPKDIGTPLTAKQVGYIDSYAFKMLKSLFEEYGMRIEDVAARLLANPKLTNEDLLTRDDVTAIHSMAQAKVMGESGADTRAHALPLGLGRNTRGGRVGQTFVGWSFWKGGEAWNMLRTPEGRRTLESVSRGALAMTLGVLPTAIAASLAIDLYDEKLTKKRANWMAYHSGMTPPELMEITLQRAAQMGSFGLPLEIVSNFIRPTDQSGQRPLAVDQRIVWINAISQFYQSIRTLNVVGLDDANYANVGRQMLASLGGGGLLQNIQLLNGLFGPIDAPLFREEASVTARINMNNFLRAAGTQLHFELRAAGGSTASPNELTPNITNMLLASLRNNREEFFTSYRKAIAAATRLPGVTDPEKKVKESFEARNPLRNLFRGGAVTESEFAEMLRVMPDQGREAVVQGLRLINGYGEAIGVKPFAGTTQERKNAALTAVAARYGITRENASMDAVRRAQRLAERARDDSGF